MKNVQTGLTLLIIILAMIGIADAGYLTYEKVAGVTPPCAPGYDCGKVLNSQWASIGPIPLSVFGLGYYLTVFSLAIAHFLEIIKGKKLLWLLTSTGFLFSLYLVFLMAVIIKAWCFYCLISAGTSSILFVLASLLNLTDQHEQNPE